MHGKRVSFLVFLLVGMIELSGLAGPVRSGTPFLANAGPEAYAQLLQTYVVVVGPGATRFDYEAFAEAPDQRQIRDQLRESFLAVEPSVLGPKVKTAWAINAYNFLIIDFLMDHYLESNGALASIMSLNTRRSKESLFDQERFTIGGKPYSFNSFERTFLFDRDVPEPRAHYAIVCGAVGCPPLQPWIYKPSRLDADLNRAVSSALENPRHFRKEGSVAHVSKLFEWYAEDFAAYLGGASGFLADHGKVISTNAKIRSDIPWDWSLNRP